MNYIQDVFQYKDKLRVSAIIGLAAITLALGIMDAYSGEHHHSTRDTDQSMHSH